MLVYCSKLVLSAKNGSESIVQQVARWMGSLGGSFVDPIRLESGIRELVLAKGQRVQARTNQIGESSPKAYPYLFCTKFSHADQTVSGRRWVTEIGIRQDGEDEDIECSFLLKTDEISARVTAPIQVTRPRLVDELAKNCSPTPATAGTRIKTLDVASAHAYLAAVEREDRSAPLVVTSCTIKGEYMISPDRLKSLLIGLADVVDIPNGTDTFTLEDIVGRRYSAWGGAINIIFPPRPGASGGTCESVLFRPAQLADMLESGTNIESEVLAAITHRTNLPMSWRHISLEVVQQARLRNQLAQAIADSKTDEQNSVFTDLLIEADKELSSKDKEISELRSILEESSADLRKSRAEVDTLNHALDARANTAFNESEEIQKLRRIVFPLLNGSPSLEECLDFVEFMYGSRVIVLPSARKSAQDSSDFKYGKVAIDLLAKLADGYWEALNEGKPDAQAKSVFGRDDYAAQESKKLSADGKSRRTFQYKGQPILMERHLKHGVKDSSAETLRIHFEWVAPEKRIVIGHCGKHLDF
ncbi:hypothetical protein [Dyella sedimenti]|uniref:hypothetical protein n=1 Tax=Dyella sedimenti TaxID=2919947 RepID=UPI001FA98597|nr:hypothetical protein [Dyella sedimenti]